MYTFVICSPFVEHPIVDVAHYDAGEFDIFIFEEGQPSNFLNKSKFNLEQYCKCLLHKLFTIQKSKIKPFIQYQCDKMQEPIVWLNKLEKLIDLNRELFTTKDQVIKFEKSLMIIEVMRDVIEQKKQAPDSKFNFVKLKSDIKQYNYEEKVSYLMEAKTEYLQNKPKIIDVNETPFDEKINLELDLIKSQQKLNKKQNTSNNQEVNSPKSPTKNTKSPTDSCRTSVGLFQFNCQTNIFVDVFFQLTKEISVDGKPLLNAGFNELAQFITDNFIDKNGNPLSLNTVKTILNTSRPEKRPSSEKRINLKIKNIPK
ncbi:hypothetical protein [Flavobacterium sp. UBA7680]|uniref:hypothetical protein n=1 Tax=Flavobacterium sp. UBA7680 TaxID=1946559 RepID=UPI0025C236A9|nr:hypothetical protein [Flavobacterium sp. UBA7680]